MILETTMEQLASELLDDKYSFQTFAEQVAKLLDGRDETFAQRVRFKATAEFLDELDRYIANVRATNLRANSIRIGMITLDSNWISNLFSKWAGRSVNDQLNGVVNAIVEHMKFQHQKEVVGKERARVRKELRQMFADTNLKTIYKNFYTWLERPEMFKQGAKGSLEYADVFPLVYVKSVLERTASRNDVKHVVVDEMQDYTPVQYRVLAMLYPTKMTILGDRNQSVNPFSGGVIISTAYLAKGLEFDEIIVPFCSAREYNSDIDRHMLYVAVTRAMHSLTITHSGELTPLLQTDAGVSTFADSINAS